VAETFVLRALLSSWIRLRRPRRFAGLDLNDFDAVAEKAFKYYVNWLRKYYGLEVEEVKAGEVKADGGTVKYKWLRVRGKLLVVTMEKASSNRYVEYWIGGGVQNEKGVVEMLPFMSDGLGLVMQVLHVPKEVPPVMREPLRGALPL